MGQMTDSTQTPTQGKRERLAAGAREVIHRHGVEATTIADIAEAARVPVGNVYYYFKTKDELVEAAIDSRARDVRSLMDSRELAAQYGCPLGSLCSELDKRTDGLDRTCAQLLELPVHGPSGS